MEIQVFNPSTQEFETEGIQSNLSYKVTCCHREGGERKKGVKEGKMEKREEKWREKKKEKRDRDRKLERTKILSGQSQSCMYDALLRKSQYAKVLKVERMSLAHFEGLRRFPGRLGFCSGMSGQSSQRKGSPEESSLF